jgi:hypothetical protein
MAPSYFTLHTMDVKLKGRLLKDEPMALERFYPWFFISSVKRA